MRISYDHCNMHASFPSPDSAEDSIVSFSVRFAHFDFIITRYHHNNKLSQIAPVLRPIRTGYYYKLLVALGFGSMDVEMSQATLGIAGAAGCGQTTHRKGCRLLIRNRSHCFLGPKHTDKQWH